MKTTSYERKALAAWLESHFIICLLLLTAQPDDQLSRPGDHLDLLPGLKTQRRHPAAFKGNGGLGGSGNAKGTTQTAVADGAITIRNPQQQQQDVAALGRDTEHANGSINSIFGKEKEQKRLQLAQLAGDIAGHMRAACYVAEHYYHVDLTDPASQLSEGRRQELSLMSTLEAGLASGLAGNSTVAASAGAQTGRTRLRITSLGQHPLFYTRLCPGKY